MCLCFVFAAMPHFGPAVASLNPEGSAMLMTIFVILLVLWLLGMVTSYTLYGYIHILLVIAIVVFLIRVIQGRNPL
jgi:predicted ferric reductase